MTHAAFVKADVFIQLDMPRQDYGCSVVLTSADGARKIMRVSLEDYGDHHITEPTFAPFGPVGSVRDFLQAMIDEAHRAGIRPTAESYDRDAQRRHLEDMRALVFAGAQMETPK